MGELEGVGYTTLPPVDELASFSEAQLACVAEFGVARPGFGSVVWRGDTDVRRLDVARHVCIEQGRVVVADAAAAELDKPAVITLEGVYDDDPGRPVREYERVLSAALEGAPGAPRHVSYSPVGGRWVFEVQGFPE